MATRDSVRKRLMTKYRSITLERLQNLNNAFLQLEQDPTNASVAEALMREVHTLKGEAKMMGFAQINVVAHRTEDLLSHCRACRFRPQPQINDLVLRGFDIVGVLIGAPPQGDRSVDVDGFVRRVERVLSESTDDVDSPPGGAPKATEKAGSPPKTAHAQASDSSGDHGGRETAAAGPEAETESAAAREAAASKLQAPQEDARGAERAAVHAEAPGAGTPTVADHRSLRLKTRASIRVEMSKLDGLTDLTSDLVLSQSRMELTLRTLVQLTDAWRSESERLRSRARTEAEASQANPDLLQHTVAELGQGIGYQAAVLRDMGSILSQARDETFDNRLRLDALEERVRELRLVPLSTLFDRFPRAARDLAREQRKSVAIEVAGADVSVDSDVLDQIGEPLLHLIRNCVDHGLEIPRERMAAGKPAEGAIVLAAEQRGAVVEVSVRDDGRGIDPERIRGAAVKRRMIAPSEADSLTPDMLFRYLFRPGFSTRERVTDVSGRGVGLDVVKQQVDLLGGSVDLQSRVGQGTTFRLTIPVSMVLARTLIMEVSGSLYAVPSQSVYVATEVREDELETVGMARTFRVDDLAVPIADLASIVGASPLEPSPQEPFPVVVLQQRGARRALRVGAFVGERQVVQRRLDPFLEGLPLINGTAVLEGGELALLCSVPELMAAAGQHTLGHVATTDSADAEGSPTILVVDDSEMTRDLVVGILQSMGFQVTEAVNGAEALQKLNLERPDIIMTDLEMPVMDGFQLLAELRRSVSLAAIPVVVFSTRGSDADRRKAAELGADAYLVKTTFRGDDLVRVAQRFLPHRHLRLVDDGQARTRPGR